MWINIVVLLFVLGVAYFFSTQGLFSAFLHLVVTIIAGAIALAVWEPLTVNFLLERMPEYAWGVGLLAPFALILLGLRLLSDKLILGNLDLNYLTNTIGGGAVGFVSGILIAGFLVISLQFIGSFPVVDYKPYIIEAGQMKRQQTLWLKCDDIVSGLYGMLSGGAYHPYSGQSLSRYEPGLARAAGEFHTTARRIGRTAIRPSSIKVLDTYTLEGEDVKKELNTDAISVTGDFQVVIIGTEILAAAADKDGVFTASKAQVSLLHGDGKSTYLTHPDGYLQSKTFGSFAKPNNPARSSSGGAFTTFHWVFVIPTTDTPYYLQVKQLRLAIPEFVPGEKGIAARQELLADTDWDPKDTSGEENTGTNTGVTTVGPTHGPPGGADGIAVAVTPELPYPVGRNDVNMAGGSLDEIGIVSANVTVDKPRGRLGANLSVNKISYDSQASAIIRLQVEPRKARSLFGKAVAAATNVTPPYVIDANGTPYSCLGFVKHSGDLLRIKIDTDAANPMRSLSDAEVQNLRDDEQLLLYFRVGRPNHITQFKIGRTTVPINVPVQ